MRNDNKLQKCRNLTFESIDSPLNPYKFVAVSSLTKTLSEKKIFEAKIPYLQSFFNEIEIPYPCQFNLKRPINS